MKLQDIYNDSLVITLDQLKADSELVQQIEIRLKILGLLDTAEVDGVWRNSTESALVEFCRLAFLNNMNTKVFCQSCRTRRSTTVNTGELKCIPWHGRFAPDLVTPLNELGEPILPGNRICGMLDCVNPEHIER